MNVGIYLSATPTAGGVYQYSRMILHSLEHFGEPDIRYYGLYWNPVWEEPLAACKRITALQLSVDNGDSFWADLRLGGWAAVRRKVLRRLCYWRLMDPSRVVIQQELRRVLDRIPIDLVVYPCGSAASFEIGIPYVLTVPDLEHRRQPEIPDYREQMRARDYTYEWGTKYAMAVWSYSEPEKEDVTRFYGADSRKIRVLPLLPWATMLATGDGTTGRVSPQATAEKYKLPEKFLFYPAQFWMCKNHVRLIGAIEQVRTRWNVSIPLVLVGSPKAAFRETMDLVGSLGLQEQVRYLGFVSDAEVAALYKLATGLVLPTFLGPTNIPPLEAFAAGCPVLISDLRGLREQWGDAVVYVNPYHVDDMAEKIYQFFTDEELRKCLIEGGHKIITRYTLEDFARIVNDTIRQCLLRLQAGNDHQPLRRSHGWSLHPR